MKKIMQQRIIKPTELSRILGLSKVTLWRMEKKGELPARKKVGSHLVGWLSTDIDKFLSELPNADKEKDTLERGHIAALGDNLTQKTPEAVPRAHS